MADEKLRVFLILDSNTQWSEWGLCSQTCGTGVQERSRSDNNPSPAFGGQLCDQSTQETKSCQIEPCPGKYLF